MQQKSLFRYFLECFTKNYFNFGGRARRREYWGFILFFGLLSILIAVPTIIALIPTFPTMMSPNLLTRVVKWVTLHPDLWFASLALFLLMLTPAWAVQTRRLHDRGMSGWWLVGNIALSVLNNNVTDISNSIALKLIISLASIALGIYLLAQMLLEGERKPNRYGEDPKLPKPTEQQGY